MMSNMYQLLSQSRPRGTGSKPTAAKLRAVEACSRDANGFPRMISLLDAKNGSYRTQGTEEESSTADTTVSMLEVPYVLKDSPMVQEPSTTESSPSFEWESAASAAKQDVATDDSYFKEQVARASRRPTVVVRNMSRRDSSAEAGEQTMHFPARTMEERREEIIRLRARVKDRLKEMAVDLDDDDNSSLPCYEDDSSQSCYDDDDSSGDGIYFDLYIDRSRPSRFERRRQEFRQINWSTDECSQR